MKVVYEPNEIERIEKAHKQCIENGYYGGLFNSQDPDRLYGLTFKVTNPALAECILVGLLNNRLENFELGIDVQSIELDTTTMNRSALKEKLLRAIDEIL